MSVAERLRAARALIEKPENWLKGFLSTDAEGRMVATGHHTACKFCAVGALWGTWGQEGSLVDAHGFLKQALIIQGLLKTSVSDFNDAPSTTHAQVMSMFDKAIELAEKEEPANAGA